MNGYELVECEQFVSRTGAVSRTGSRLYCTELSSGNNVGLSSSRNVLYISDHLHSKLQTISALNDDIHILNGAVFWFVARPRLLSARLVEDNINDLGRRWCNGPTDDL
jgi:hypothetical protein